ncbi:DNA repair protein RecO [Piscinibacter sp.]|uniref:DNA repair protein RecO n=1 Tax=Piscinibacter sp. TaxID=1903157 RepID=UPI001DDC544A|nr:DNA repair protein RecO [Piscinibacter sp.]MBK7529679.1 DNA repair protein RecO [Piscinibacter sp.]
MATARGAAPLAAFVLHRYDWSESSLIVELFTRSQGRVAVAARGARRPHSNLRAVLLPFQRVNVSLGRLPEGEGAGEVQTLRQAEWGGGASMLTGAALFSGFYLNELLMKLLARHDPHPALCDSYAQTLPLLGPGEDARHAGRAARAFELTLLQEIGLLPDLSVATQTQQPLQPAALYALRPEAGVIEARGDESGLSGATLVGVQAALEHGSLEALQQACAGALPALKAHAACAASLSSRLRPLRTRQVMLDVQNLAP